MDLIALKFGLQKIEARGGVYLSRPNPSNDSFLLSVSISKMSG